MSIEKRAEQVINREIGRRTSTSVFDGKGQLRHDAAALSTDGEIKLGEYLDMSMIPFAPDPDGSDHCTNLARLAEYMGHLDAKHGGLGPLDLRDQRILHAVGMLYCVGKGNMKDGGLVDVKGSSLASPFGEKGYEARSATFAESFFRNGGAQGTIWGKQDQWRDVCHLIALHNDERAIKEDVRLQLFADARRLELARLWPNTGEGLALIKREWEPEKFYSGWAKDKMNARTWMTTRGWR